MAKYGKKFRKVQIEEWKKKYLDYKKFKQMIKKFVSEKNSLIPENSVDAFDRVTESIYQFTDQLDKDIKKVYIFFTNKEKKLYKDINKFLHQKEDYPDFDLSEYLVHFNLLYELSKYNLNLAIFVYYNLKAVLKILKKFDHKVIGLKDKDNHILFTYIQTKLEEQNSDILYLFRLKMIDETNVILESLIKYLRECLKGNKSKFKEEENQIEDNKININDDENQEKLMNNNDNILTYNEVYNNIEKQYKKIQKNMQNIDLIAISTIKMFDPWKEFLRISTDVSSKLMQMNKEFSFSDVCSADERKYSRSRSMSIADNISFSKQNKYNIGITLCHGFLYNFSYAVVIPYYTAYVDDFNVDKFFYGILMMMAPLGALIGYIYEIHFFKHSTKLPYIASMIELMLGNLLYIIAKKIDIIYCLLAGRFFVGLSNIRSHNKMYIINYLSKKDTNYYLTLFHGVSILGLFSGFFINIFYNKETFSGLKNTTIFNEKTLGSFIILFLSIIFLFVIIFLYSEAKSKKFNKLSVSKIVRNAEPIQKQGDAPSINESEPNVDVQKDALIIQDIDKQLDKYNKKNKYDDTNLVSKSISEITDQEKENLNSLKKSFIVFMFMIFTTKFINESLIIYFGLNLIKIDENILNDKPYLHALVLSLAYLMVIIIELALSKKIECTRDKYFLVIIISMNLINITTLVYFAQMNKLILIISTSIAIILANMIQKTSSHFFFTIIPSHYIICCIQGNFLINIISTIGRIISCVFLIMYKKNEESEIVNKYFDVFYYSMMTLFSLITLLLYFIFYSDIRVKAISRIIKYKNKNEIKVATEV